MKWRPDLPRLSAISRRVAFAVSVAVLVAGLGSGGAGTSGLGTAAARQLAPSASAAGTPPSGGGSIGPPAQPTKPTPQPQPKPTGSSLAKDLGQLIVARFAGTAATRSILAAVRAGDVGGIILFGDNTAGGVAATHALVKRLQLTAVNGGNPRLLILTDQEGGEVKRLPGPPGLAASRMGNPKVAGTQGRLTARLLRRAGVNVDLAPVADVTVVDGFMTREHRTFGSGPADVATAACAFANSLAAAGVGYTLKHFPGLGDAVASTDDGAVSVGASASLLYRDEAAYRRCGAGRRALVMISSASYRHLTGSTPAVMSPATYRDALKSDGVDAVTISDDFQAQALADQTSPARTAINAGLDMVMYGKTESAAVVAYQILDQDLRTGTLSASRVKAAAAKVRALKQSLGLV